MHKHILTILVFCLLAASCQPSDEAVRLAISKTQTAAPTLLPTATILPTEIPSPTVEPTPTYSAIVKANANLRQGPDTLYPVVTSLPANSTVTVLGISTDQQWFHVYLSSENTMGWVYANLLIYDFSIEVLSISTDYPSLPKIQFTPTQQGPIPDSDTTLKIINDTGYALRIIMNGPTHLVIDLKVGETRELQIPHGTYQYTASSASLAGVLTGSKEITIGVYEWEFFITNN